jgi:hypothetical protein
MSDTAILDSITELKTDFVTLRKDVDSIKTDVCFLKKKKLYIEDIGIGSLMGWVKLTIGIILFISALVGTGYKMIEKIDVLQSDYIAHKEYLHK